MHTSGTLFPEGMLEEEERKSIYLNDFYDAIKRINERVIFIHRHAWRNVYTHGRTSMTIDKSLVVSEYMHNERYVSAFGIRRKELRENVETR